MEPFSSVITMKTPQQSQPALAKALDLQALFVKREDLHSYGSHKGRSIPQMIKHYAKRENVRSFAISSSGNAAYAAAMTVDRYNLSHQDEPLSLTIFVGKHIDASKHKRLHRFLSEYITIDQTDRPKQRAFQFEKEGNGKNIRQSTDDLALEGYDSLIKELLKIPDLQHIVLPVSSGTAAQAIGAYLINHDLPQSLHIVQTTACHPIATALEADEQPHESSSALAIVDKVAHRKDRVVHAVKETGGTGIIVPDADISMAQSLLETHCDLSVSANGALSIAALVQKQANKKQLTGVVAAIVCGI